MNYSTTVNRGDWNSVLEQARTANVFHTPEYFDAQAAPEVGHRLLYLCAYEQDRPVGVIAGYENTSGYHRVRQVDSTAFIDLGQDEDTL